MRSNIRHLSHFFNLCSELHKARQNIHNNLIIIDNTLLDNDGFSVTDLIHFKVWLYTFNFFPISLKFPFGSADVLAFYILCWYTPRTDNNKSTKQNILKWIKN